MSSRRLATLFVALLLLAVAGCSDSDSDSTSDEGGGPADTEEASDDTGIAEAIEVVEAHLERPEEIEVTEPVGADIPEGKTVAWIQCSIPACTQLGDGLKGATDALGWELDIIDAGISPETVADAWAQAVRDEVDAVIGAGYPRAVFEESLQDLADADVPVVLINVTDPAEDGVTAVVQGADTYPPSGALMADWVLADGGTEANTLFVTSSAFPVVGLRSDGFAEEYERLCPDCELDTMEAQVADFGDALSTQIVGYLQAHPDVTYVAAGVSDMVTGLNSALEGAGLADRVKVISNDINPALEQDIRNGGPLKALTQMENVNMMWQAIDVLARIFADVPFDTSIEVEPNRWIVTEETIGDYTEPFPMVADYEDQYKALWGV